LFFSIRLLPRLNACLCSLLSTPPGSASARFPTSLDSLRFPPHSHFARPRRSDAADEAVVWVDIPPSHPFLDDIIPFPLSLHFPAIDSYAAAKRPPHPFLHYTYIPFHPLLSYHTAIWHSTKIRYAWQHSKLPPVHECYKKRFTNDSSVMLFAPPKRKHPDPFQQAWHILSSVTHSHDSPDSNQSQYPHPVHLIHSKIYNSREPVFTVISMLPCYFFFFLLSPPHSTFSRIAVWQVTRALRAVRRNVRTMTLLGGEAPFDATGVSVFAPRVVV